MKIRVIVLMLMTFIAGLTGMTYAQSATVKKTWLEHEVYKNGENGMKIHSEIDVSGMKGKQIKVIAYFYDANKGKLYGGISGYNTIDGQVCASKQSTPTYDNSTYSDYDVFIPYKALPLKSGSNTYYVQVGVYDISSEKFISHNCPWASFTDTGFGGGARPHAQGQQLLAYMDIHAKYSHSKYFNDWGTVVKTDRTTLNSGQFVFWFVYNSGWVEGIRINRCSYCGGKGSKLCLYCNGTGRVRKGYGFDSYYETCMFCQGAGRENCSLCQGKGTWGIVEALNLEKKLYYIGNMYNGAKGILGNLDENAGGKHSGVTIPMESFRNYSNYNSNNNSSDYDKCQTCGGSGKCSFCAGRGECRSSFDGSWVECSVCRGSGRCQVCNGRGKL
jgi:hypothetical protein